MFTPTYVIARTKGLTIDMTDDIRWTPQRIGGFMRGRVLGRPVSACGGIWVMHRHKQSEVYYVLLPRSIPYDRTHVMVGVADAHPGDTAAIQQEMTERLVAHREGKTHA